MRFVLSRSSHLACPYCSSDDIQRSRRKGVFEAILYTALHIKPYRCVACDGRHFRYRPSHSSAHPLISTLE